jgi:hypothetical protein
MVPPLTGGSLMDTNETELTIPFGNPQGDLIFRFE